MRVCVFCGSSDGVPDCYNDDAKQVGRRLANGGVDIVYGGASVGMMGIIADAALAAGGKVFGVVPQSLTDIEIAHGGLTQLDVVDTMTVRKERMIELSDAFVCLPGGIGTADELFEIWTLQALNYHDKPFALLNTAGYYNSLIEFLSQANDQGFLRREWLNQLHVVATPTELVRWVLSHRE